MLTAPLLISVAWLQAAAATQAPVVPAPPPREWVVIVAAPVYLPDGSIRAETTTLPTTGAGLIHLFSRKTMCAPAASAAAEPGDAAFGWRVASQIVTRSDTDVVVSLDWRRIWDAGKRVSNGPGGTVQLTLHPGDRIPLDHIANFSPSADCRAVGLGIEVKLARAAPVAPPPSASAVPLGATAGGARPVNAELWLTHTSPSGSEQVSHQVVRLPEAGGKFTFTNTALSTTRGEVSVELAGTIDRFRSPTGGEFFVLSMNRHVSGDSLPPEGISATTGTTVPMPGIDQVLSFELTGMRRAIVGAGSRGGATRGSGGGAGGMIGTRPSGGGGTTGNPTQEVPRAGAGGGAVVARGRAGTAGAAGANLAQVAALLEGHQFSLRLRVTAVN